MSVVDGARVRSRIRVHGIVQGVGFRPFVHRVAGELGVAGLVGNDGDGVFVEAEGPPAAVAALVAALRERPPPLAVVERVVEQLVPVRGDTGFVIAGSVAPTAGAALDALVSPDVATCADCLRELFDPADRRYRYPFVNCTNCGPRFTITLAVPYDRPNTTMAGFAMCAGCAREYADPADRRFHAQPVCCPACGPRLELVTAGGEPVGGDPVREAARLLDAGLVLAVKGLGGYHLAADAGDERAVALLRRRKLREDRPFAVMCRDLGAAERLVVTTGAEQLLTGVRRPIVLLPRRPDAAVAPSVAPRNRCLGVMLPYTPLHHLLAEALGRPFVLTSGNLSDEPIAYLDDDAAARLAEVADAVLRHDRPIHVRADDSVLRPAPGAPMPVRRARGYAPAPLPLPRPLRRPVLGCGAELKSTFALGRGDRVFVSHHLGDLENYETLRSFTEGVAHFRRLFAVRPEVVAHDLHPDYLSTRYAAELDGVELVGVQHHHAHIASCLADNGETGPVIGVAYDGLGLGTDGTLWGGELLVADLAGFARAGHLEPTRLPGRVTAIRQPWRTAVAWLGTAYGAATPPVPLLDRHPADWPAVARLARGGVAAPVTTSVGRLFDAVSALCGLRDAVTYEGQAAVELEQCADPAVDAGYPLPVIDADPLVLPGGALVRAVVDDLRAGTTVPVVSARFHAALAAATADACTLLRARTGIGAVALSGGVFQNALLLERLAGTLTSGGFRVLTHRQVPPNDGGISLGQVAVAGARDAAGSG